MTQPKHATESESGRFYNIPGFEHITHRSVTNIINALSKPMLYNAYAKRAGVRAVEQETEWHAIQQEHYEKLTTRKRSPLAPKEAQVKADDEAAKWIARAMKDYSAYASDMGSAVHFCCECFDEHVMVIDGEAVFDEWLTERVVEQWATKMSEYQYTVDKNVDQMRKHVTQYARFISDYEVTFIDRERTVANPEHGYAGTLDAVVRLELEGKALCAVLDLKTGGVYKESVPLQLAAYRYATHEVHGDVTKPRTYTIDSGFVLQLKPQSYNLYPVECGVAQMEAFLAVARTWDWLNEGCKDAVGEKV